MVTFSSFHLASGIECLASAGKWLIHLRAKLATVLDQAGDTLEPIIVERRSLIRSAVTAVPWVRVHPIDRSAIHFGKSANNRFTPKNSPFGVWYVAEDLHTALFELFGDEMIGDDCRIRAYRWLSYRVSEVHFSSKDSLFTTRNESIQA